ncbi:MAG: hypothetical protein KGH67_01995 [Candidatus Micrarchaeota archaeon]|nr:hypothetical protein [Candidatus Micrarchaeota archaeon]MDE1859277.1 hypothetical protein [Candidatus Micrarchaeota archaeon]
MEESKTKSREYALIIQRLDKAVKELEEYAMGQPEVRESTIRLLDDYSRTSTEPRAMRRAADEIAAVNMLEILHST